MIRELPDIPNVIPLALLNITVPDVAVCVLAPSATACADKPIVLPLVLRLMLFPAARLEVAGAEIAIWDAFVPDNVTLIPEKLRVLPDAVVLPDVAPDKLAYMAPPPPPV